jgi:hypothetical protein
MQLTTSVPILILQTTNRMVGGLTQLQDTLLLVFTVVITLAVLIQCCILISVAVAGAKARSEVIALGKQICNEAMPLLSNVQSLVSETRPQMRQIKANALAIGEIARARGAKVPALVHDITQKTQNHAAHANQIKADALHGLRTISNSIRSIVLPAKQLVTTVVAVKALVENLRTRVSPKRTDPYTAEGHLNTVLQVVSSNVRK